MIILKELTKNRFITIFYSQNGLLKIFISYIQIRHNRYSLLIIYRELTSLEHLLLKGSRTLVTLVVR